MLITPLFTVVTTLFPLLFPIVHAQPTGGSALGASDAAVTTAVTTATTQAEESVLPEDLDRSGMKSDIFLFPTQNDYWVAGASTNNWMLMKDPGIKNIEVFLTNENTTLLPTSLSVVSLADIYIHDKMKYQVRLQTTPKTAPPGLGYKLYLIDLKLRSRLVAVSEEFEIKDSSFPVLNVPQNLESAAPSNGQTGVALALAAAAMSLATAL